MTRHHAFHVFVCGFILMAIHHTNAHILKGWNPVHLIELIPYVVLLLFWSRIREMVLGFLLMLLGFLELRYIGLTYGSELLSLGVSRTTMTPILFGMGALLFIGSSMMLFQVWHRNREKERK